MQIILFPEAWPGASPRADDFGKFENLKIFLNLASGNAPGNAQGIA
ncbi:hypothetical protein T4D_10603 [Trichinella pseudospiralis]|uniref:Uncharacterized protein n=1 Tax=Trichinella pseudospiralis TaxID=6337 RepID=A0A0V1DK33_TRIPS|nr:hypothetical protein T4D_10603 [Trichinella pseudospiralis]